MRQSHRGSGHVLFSKEETSLVISFGANGPAWSNAFSLPDAAQEHLHFRVLRSTTAPDSRGQAFPYLSHAPGSLRDSPPCRRCPPRKGYLKQERKAAFSHIKSQEVSTGLARCSQTSGVQAPFSCSTFSAHGSPLVTQHSCEFWPVWRRKGRKACSFSLRTLPMDVMLGLKSLSSELSLMSVTVCSAAGKQSASQVAIPSGVLSPRRKGDSCVWTAGSPCLPLAPRHGV